jgi:hypothetical protein
MEKRMLAAEAKAVLAKLPAPEILTMMDEMLDNNNNNNNNNTETPDEAMLGREELLKSVGQLPTETLRNILRTHGI